MLPISPSLRRALVAVATAALPLALATPATASELAATAAATGSFAGDCAAGLRSGAGIAREELAVSEPGYLTASLSGGEGDWDLAVFSDRSGEPVAGGAAPGPDEVATGFALAGERLTVQTCRRPGATGSPRVEVEVEPADTDAEVSPPSLLRVATPSETDKMLLQKTGLDLTHSEGEDFWDVVAYGPDDIEALGRVGLAYSTRVRDLSRQSARFRAAEASAPTAKAAGLPSGRTGTYRRIFDYEQELKALAKRHPKLVRLFTLPEKSYEGRTVVGIEITRNPRGKQSKPLFLNMGLHHAREWPSGEHTIEWAYELLKRYKDGNRRARKLVRSTRNVIIPVVNPDGFNASREAGELQAAGGGRSAASDTEETINILTHPVEYRRKNCRFLDDSEGGSCAQPDVGLAAAGVDPNRNYGGFWGGPGASTDPTAADYRGPGPFSEPETRNIQRYMSRNQVTAFISNHTFTGLVLRPPAIAAQGPTVDEPLYRKVGARMTKQNGYVNQPSYELYDTSGGTEDWAYYATGSLGYTFEIGRFAFHPNYAEMVDEWTGRSGDFEMIGGNREAYWKIARFSARDRSHSVLTGKGPRRGTLIAKKKFKTATSPVLDESGAVGEVIRFQDRLKATTRIRRRGGFSFHLNPSTRPVVAQERGERNAGPPSDPQGFSGSAAGTTPCADYDTEDPTCWNDHPFTVPDEPGRSNTSALIRAEWPTPASDWDMKVFRDSDGDGSSEGEKEVGASGQGLSTFEQTTVADLKPGEKYVIRMQNYAALEPYDGTITFLPPEPYSAPRKERWTLVCKNRKGKRTGQRKVLIERGQSKRLDLRRGC